MLASIPATRFESTAAMRARLGARDLLRSLRAWRSWRGAPAPAVGDRDGVKAEAPASFPLAAYNAAIDKLVEMARAAGAAEERARIAAIMTLPTAERFPRLAWRLASSGAVGPEQAAQAFVAADLDSPAPAQPTSGALDPERGRVLH